MPEELNVKINASIQIFNDWISGNNWSIQIAIIVLITLLCSIIVKFLLSRLLKRLEHTPTPWDNAFVQSLLAPITLLIWVLGLAFASSIIEREMEITALAIIPTLRDACIVIIVAWFAVRFIKNAQKAIIELKQAKGAEIDHTTAEAISKLLRLSVFIIASLVILQTLGYSISGVLAFGGIGGLALGFAAKDLLSNFFGGLMIYLDRPFNVGDWIRSPDRDIEGTVENIGWRQTRIRTFDKRPLHVPNSVFSTIAVENPSRMTHRRIYETIGIRYDDARHISAITHDVKNMLLNHPEIDTTQTMIVNFNHFAPSSLDFFIYTFTKTTDWVKFHEIKHDILLKINDIIEAHGAQTAFPTTTINIPLQDKKSSFSQVDPTP